MHNMSRASRRTKQAGDGIRSEPVTAQGTRSVQSEKQLPPRCNSSNCCSLPTDEQLGVLMLPPKIPFSLLQDVHEDVAQDKLVNPDDGSNDAATEEQ